MRVACHYHIKNQSKRTSVQIQNNVLSLMYKKKKILKDVKNVSKLKDRSELSVAKIVGKGYVIIYYMVYQFYYF